MTQLLKYIHKLLTQKNVSSFMLELYFYFFYQTAPDALSLQMEASPIMTTLMTNTELWQIHALVFGGFTEHDEARRKQISL